MSHPGGGSRAAGVLVSRPEPGAGATARRLAALGYLAVVAPVSAIRPLPGHPPRSDIDALVVTSANAVAAAGERLRPFRNRTVFAVGDRTASALRDAGFTTIRTASGDGTALARLVAETIAAPAAILHVGGRDRRPEPARTLAAAGFALAVWEVYAAEAERHLPDAVVAALRTGELHAALHFSPRSAAVLAELCGQAGLAEAFGRLAHLCLSEEVARGLSAIPPGRLSVAAAPTEDSLLAALETWGAGAGSRPR